jgi:hypothetical protein
MEWGNKYLNSYDTVTKVENYYFGLTGDKNIVYDNLHTNEKYSNILQMFRNNHLELRVKYAYFNFFHEKLCEISSVHPRDWSSRCKPHVEDFSELLSVLGIMNYLTTLTMTVFKCM